MFRKRVFPISIKNSFVRLFVVFELGSHLHSYVI